MNFLTVTFRKSIYDHIETEQIYNDWDVAIRTGLSRDIRSLLKRGIDCSHQAEALLWAVKNENIYVLKVLLTHRISSEQVLDLLLMWKYQLKASDAEIKNKITVYKGIDGVDSLGSTALHYASKYKQMDILKLLLKSNADPNIKNILNDTPLSLAINKFGVNYEIIGLLMQYGANLKDDEKAIYKAVELEYVDTILYLLENGAIPSSNVLFCTNKQKIVKILLEYGADPNSKDREGTTILIKRARDIPIVKLLLEYGADPNLESDYGECPLEIAIIWNMKEYEQLLRQYGATITYYKYKKSLYYRRKFGVT